MMVGRSQLKKQGAWKMRIILYAKAAMWFLLAASTAAWGQLQPIPKESGFSGFVNAGVLYLDVESNLIAGNDVVDVGDKVITSLTSSPRSSDDVTPMLNFDLRYTFASTRTQLFVGNSLEDFIRLDLTSQAGVRQGLSDRSSVSASLVFSSVPTEVWADPYVVNVPRRKTDTDTKGIRLNWDRILDSNFTLQYTYRDIDLDKEQSGLTQLGLPRAQASLLDRNGDHHRAEVIYRWQVAPRHTLLPAYRYEKFDLDGDAMANDQHTLQITYAYRGDRFSVALNAEYVNAEYDAVNPIYGKTRDQDGYGGALQLFWHGPFGAPKDLSLLGTVAAYESDANIAFYDASVFASGVSLFYRF